MRDKPWPERPADAVTSTTVVNIDAFVNKDRRVTLQAVACQFGISKASAHQIVHKKTRYEQGNCYAGAETADRGSKDI